MATTTATLSISSPDLTPGSPLNISASAILTKAGVTDGLDQKLSGVIKVAVGSPTEHRLGPLATEMVGDAHDIASYLYVCNTTTVDTTYYIEYKIHETVIGRLYAGDWMFVPYNASDGDAEIEVKALNGINKIEYAMFKTAWTLPAAES